MPPSPIWTTPRDWTNGELATAAVLNGHIRDNLQALYQKGCQRGIAFPGSPATGDVFFRTDQIRLYYYTGSVWALVNADIGARVYNSANIATANITTTVLTFDSERWDSDTFHSTSVNTGRLTIPSGLAGKYMATGHVRFAANATGTRRVQIQRNGADVLGFNIFPPAAGGDVTVLSIATIADLAVGDYLELATYQSSGGSLNIDAAASYSPEFAIARL